MHEITAAKQIVGALEGVLDKDILHRELAVTEADVEFGGPLTIGGLAADTYVGHGHSRREAILARRIISGVKKNTTRGRKLELGLAVIVAAASGHFTRQKPVDIIENPGSLRLFAYGGIVVAGCIGISCHSRLGGYRCFSGYGFSGSLFLRHSLGVQGGAHGQQ